MHTEADIAVLECRSQAQALDWSLVLISQGIESVPARRAEDGAWVLEVPGHEWARARESIAAYERENATVWRREVKWTGLLFDAHAVLWFLALVLFHFLAWHWQKDFQPRGMMHLDAVRHGEWWRVFTAMTLHADAAHLAANATTGLVFLGLAMGCFGAGGAWLLSLLGGALSFVVTGLLRGEPYFSRGASGFVMASLGLLAAHSLMLSRHEKRVVWIGRGVIAGSLLVVMLGLSPESDVTAHVCGFFAGLVLGVMALRFHVPLAKRGLSVACAVAGLVLVVATWWLALR